MAGWRGWLLRGVGYGEERRLDGRNGDGGSGGRWCRDEQGLGRVEPRFAGLLMSAGMEG